MLRRVSAVATIVPFAFALQTAAFAEEASTKEEEKKTDESVVGRMKGSEVSLQHSVSLTSFDRGYDLSYNPSLLQVVGIEPHYKINEQIDVLVRAEVETELTNSDVTNRRREPLFKDMVIEGSYALPELPQKILTSASLRFTLPTSQESAARERILGFRGGVSGTRKFEVAPKISLSPIVALAGSAWAATAQGAIYDGPTITTCGPDLDCTEFDHSGARTSRATLTEVVGLSARFPYRLSASLQAGWVQSSLYPLVGVTYPDGTPIPESANNVDWQYYNVYGLSAKWRVHEHAAVEAGLQTLSPQLRQDSSGYYAPMLNRFTEFFVTATAVL